MVKNYLLTLAYDGTGFYGWQIQPTVRTVQGELQRVLRQLAGEEVRVNGTSRTDAGVHALGQCASFHGDVPIPTERLAMVLNRQLPEDLAVRRVQEMPMAFHARYDAKGKEYIYKVMNCAEKNVFQRNFYYFYERPLRWESMQEAAAHFIGRHDFAGFMAVGGNPRESTVRTLFDCQVQRGEAEEELRFVFRGDGFLYNMVRILVGTLMEVGRGRIDPGQIPDILASKDRSRGGETAPPQGLYLSKVFYGEDEWNEHG